MLHKLIIYIYLLYGIINKKNLSRSYLYLLLFFNLKIIINYRKCTLSYIEYKITDNHNGKINQFINSIIDIRYTDHIYLILLISFIIMIQNYDILF